MNSPTNSRRATGSSPIIAVLSLNAYDERNPRIRGSRARSTRRRAGQGGHHLAMNVAPSATRYRLRMAVAGARKTRRRKVARTGSTHWR